MKKIAFLVCALLVAATTFGQSTTPRFGTAKNTDYTGRVITYGYISKTDASSATVDTITTALTTSYQGKGFSKTLVVFNVTDSAVFSLSSIANCYLGDELTVILKNTIASSASFVNFLGYSGLATKWNMASTGTKITLAASKNAVVKFVFDGAKWNECSRSVQ